MSMGPRSLPWQQCTNDAPHAGHSHVNGGPCGGCGLPEWCPGVPEPRSTPGPSTGTPEPSQAASEWIATSHTPPSLDQPVRREAWFDGYRAAREDACLDVCSGEVARLREVVELVRVGVSEMLAAMCPDPKCGHGECDAYATVIAWLREVVHPSDGPAPDEATR